ncbi:MAG: hypothetical protein Q9184_001739 [Pyrenodesmia sp. 2 TL-2023]
MALILAIIVACLATLRNLFSCKSSHPKSEQPAAPGSSNLFPRGSGNRKKMRDILDSLASMPDTVHTGYRQQSENTSDAQSIINHHFDGAHDLDELSKAVMGIQQETGYKAFEILLESANKRYL